MRVTLNKRLTKLEQSIPPKAQVEANEAAWRQAFKEFGLPADTPVPQHMPIIIRAVIDADGTVSDEFLSVNGRYVSRPQVS
jgi:hypothetical protein